MKKYLLIEVNEDCNLRCAICKETCFIHPSVRVNAKEAVGVDINFLSVTFNHGHNARISNPKVDGKPVKLYAVEDK